MHAEIATPARPLSGAAVGRSRMELARVIAPALTALLLLVAGVIAARRLVGALERPLPPAALVSAGVLLVLLAASARLVAPAGVSLRRGRRMLIWLPTAAVLVAGWALTLPGTSPGWIAGFWSVLIGGEALGHVASRLMRRRLPKASGEPAGRTRRLDPPHPSAAPAGALPAIPTDEIPADEVTQQLTRSVAGEGADVLSGWLRAGFLPGQRTASVHVAFCPPFAKTPRLSVEQLDGPSARIKTAQLLPYGTRLDLKLAQPATEAADVLLRFRAECPA